MHLFGNKHFSKFIFIDDSRQIRPIGVYMLKIDFAFYYRFMLILFILRWSTMKISKEDAKIFDFLSPIHIEKKRRKICWITNLQVFFLKMDNIIKDQWNVEIKSLFVLFLGSTSVMQVTRKCCKLTLIPCYLFCLFFSKVFLVFGVCVLNLKNRKNVRWLALIQFYSTTTACNGYIVNETLVDCCALVWNRKKYWKNETTNKTVFFFVNFIYFCSCWFDVIVLKIRYVTRMGYSWSSVWIWISHVSLSVLLLFIFVFVFD